MIPQLESDNDLMYVATGTRLHSSYMRMVGSKHLLTFFQIPPLHISLGG
jgi:hypothetical protein